MKKKRSPLRPPPRQPPHWVTQHFMECDIHETSGLQMDGRSKG